MAEELGNAGRSQDIPFVDPEEMGDDLPAVGNGITERLSDGLYPYQGYNNGAIRWNHRLVGSRRLNGSPPGPIGLHNNGAYPRDTPQDSRHGGVDATKLMAILPRDCYPVAGKEEGGLVDILGYGGNQRLGILFQNNGTREI